MSSESLDLIHKMYVAYYQRMADPEGLIYWEQQVDSFGWNTVSAAFSNAQESSDLYGNTTAESLVKKIYEAAFERAATDEEANWWAHESGHQKADLAFAIVNGAQGEDAATIDKKVTYSEYFVEVLDPDCDGEGPFAYSYSGSDDADRGREALSRITKDTDVSISNVSTDTSLLFESNNYDEGNGLLYNLAGTYSLLDFSVTFDTGKTSNGSDDSFSGYMSIKESGDMMQRITVNGLPLIANGKIAEVTEDSWVMISSGHTYNMNYSFDGDMLITYADAHQFGGTYIETDYWEYAGA